MDQFLFFIKYFLLFDNIIFFIKWFIIFNYLIIKSISLQYFYPINQQLITNFLNYFYLFLFF